jgi:hypothetical protein
MMRTFQFVLFCLFLLPFQASAEEEGKAKIVTSHNKASQCISPVHIRKIDGREVAVQRMGFDLDPGKHTMAGSAIIDTSFCPVVGKSTSYGDSAPPLEAEFEAGKTYYVGLDHSASNRNDWKYVIWKVKD